MKFCIRHPLPDLCLAPATLTLRVLVGSSGGAGGRGGWMGAGGGMGPRSGEITTAAALLSTHGLQQKQK